VARSSRSRGRLVRYHAPLLRGSTLPFAAAMVAREMTVVVIKGEPLATQRVDIVVNHRLVVEAKSTVDLRVRDEGFW
jgi:hypothetical protein